MVKTPMPINLNVINWIWYFKDENNVHCYLDKVSRHVYEDRIEVPEGLEIKPKKKKTSITVPEHIGSF